MPSGVSFTGSLVLLALFVAPGLLAIKVGHYFSRATDRTDRLDATVASLLTSVVSLSLLYFLVGISSGQSPTLSELESAFSIPRFIHGYAALLSVACLMGMYYGIYRHHIVNSEFHISELWAALSSLSKFEVIAALKPAIRGDKRSTRQEVWDYVFDRIYSESEVKIYLCNGDETLKGEVLVWGDSPKRDLLLSPESREELESDGTPSETYRYISYQDISHIRFNEDLNKNDRNVAEREVGDEPDHPNPEADLDLAQHFVGLEMKERGLSSREELFKELEVDGIKEFSSKLLENEEFRAELEVDSEPLTPEEND